MGRARRRRRRRRSEEGGRGGGTHSSWGEGEGRCYPADVCVSSGGQSSRSAALGEGEAAAVSDVWRGRNKMGTQHHGPLLSHRPPCTSVSVPSSELLQ